MLKIALSTPKDYGQPSYFPTSFISFNVDNFKFFHDDKNYEEIYQTLLNKKETNS